MSKAPEKPKKYEDRLMDAFAFDEDDLDANQAGQFSQAQIASLKAARNRAILQFVLMWLMIGVLSAIVVGLGMRAGGLLLPVMAALLVISAFSFIFSKARRLMQDLGENRILAAEGRVDLSIQGDYDYFLLVEKQRFRLKQKDIFLTFKNGDPYRIYYTPRSRQILSVEWLRENDDNLLDAGESHADLDFDSASETLPDQQLRRPSR